MDGRGGLRPQPLEEAAQDRVGWRHEVRGVPMEQCKKSDTLGLYHE